MWAFQRTMLRFKQPLHLMNSIFTHSYHHSRHAHKYVDKHISEWRRGGGEDTAEEERRNVEGSKRSRDRAKNIWLQNSMLSRFHGALSHTHKDRQRSKQANSRLVWTFLSETCIKQGGLQTSSSHWCNTHRDNHNPYTSTWTCTELNRGI